MIYIDLEKNISNGMKNDCSSGTKCTLPSSAAGGQHLMNLLLMSVSRRALSPDIRYYSHNGATAELCGGSPRAAMRPTAGVALLSAAALSRPPAPCCRRPHAAHRVLRCHRRPPMHCTAVGHPRAAGGALRGGAALLLVDRQSQTPSQVAGRLLPLTVGGAGSMSASFS